MLWWYAGLVCTSAGLAFTGSIFLQAQQFLCSCGRLVIAVTTGLQITVALPARAVAVLTCRHRKSLYDMFVSHA
jgi:hypothetical protein